MAVFVFAVLLAGLVVAVDECCPSCSIYRRKLED
jgi:hypothetical protein